MTSTAISAQGTKGYIAGVDGSALIITAITKATQAVVTAANTLSAGDVVVFGTVTGMPEIEGLIGIVQATGLSSSTFTTNIDSSGFASAGTTGAATPKTMTKIGNVKDWNGFDGQKSEIDVSNLDSTAKEFIAMCRPGMATL